MTARRFLVRARARLAVRLRRLRASESGVAAVEFALVLPFMVALYFGLTELTTAVMMDRKLAILSRALGDLPAQKSQVSTSDLDNIFNAAALTMRPYSSSTTQMVISSILVTQVGPTTYTGAVDWSCGRNLAALAVRTADPANNLSPRVTGTPYSVPTGFQNTSTQSFILVETILPYLPNYGHFITSTIRFRENATWPVRSGTKVAGPGTCPSN